MCFVVELVYFCFAFAVIRLSGAVTLTPDQASSCP